MNAGTLADARHLADQIIAFRQGAPDADDAIYWLNGICREAQAFLDRTAPATPTGDAERA